MIGVVDKWVPVVMFRDTGEEQSSITSRMLFQVKKIDLEDVMLLQDIAGAIQRVPLMQAFVKSSSSSSSLPIRMIYVL